MTNMINIQWLGYLDYMTAWEMQKSIVQQVASGDISDQLLLLEHPPTYTIGRKGKDEHLLYDDEKLAAEQIVVHHVDRGGDITYHGPGQLIGYPIINLKRWQVDYPNPTHYLRSIEKTIMMTLAQFGIESWQYPGYTGVWVHHIMPESPIPEPCKIAAIGAKFNGNGVSSHGFAINVSPEMTHFDGIIPCGISEHHVTCMRDMLHKSVTTEQLIPYYVRAFESVFDCSINNGQMRVDHF